MRVFTLLILLFLTTVFAKEITPYRYITASEAVSDFVKVGDTLIIGTEEGIIDIYDLKQDKLVDQIKRPKYKNILGDYMRSLILSVDYYEGRLLFVSRVLDGWRELYIYENRTLTNLIDETQKMTLQKVKFVDAERAIIATMGNELILFDIKKRKIIYKKQLNYASFSDLTLDEEHTYLYTSDETPMISKIEINSGKIIEEYKKANKRDVFSIDYKNGLLLSGGKDRRVILYKTPEQYKMTKGDFFIYGVALNPDASKAAFVKNESSEISVIDTNDLKEQYLLKGHEQTIIKIDFHLPNELITADEDDRLMFWRLE
ncbi:MAG: WD40 repeat domain-containing protein [Sulfurimonadaceae bacterium]